MFRVTYLTMLVLSLSLLVLGQLEDEEDGWLDPGDMLNYDSGARKMKPPALETCEKCDCDEISYIPLEKMQTLETNLVNCLKEKELTDEPESPESCDGQGGNEGLFFRQYIRSLLVSFPAEGSYQTQVTLTAADLAALHQFASTEGGRVEDAHHVLLNMVDHVIPLENPMYLSLRQKLENFLGIDLSSLFLVLGAIMMCSITFSVLVRIHVPWSQILWKLFLALFILSIPWNWWYLYKKAVAKRHADLLKDVPPECNPKDQSASQSLFQWVVSSFTFSSDACAKYHEKMLVDPIWEVPPTQALAVTLSKFFLEPLEHLGVAVKRMIRGLLEDMPIHMWPVVIILFIFLTTFILVLLCGYRIQLFWNIFGLEPGHPAPQPAGGMAALPHQPENISYQGAIQNRPANQSTEEDPTRQPVSVSYRPPVPSTSAPVLAASHPHPETALHPDTPDGGIVHGRRAQARPPPVAAGAHTSHPTLPVEAHTSHRTVPAEAHTRGAEGIHHTQLPSGERDDGCHTEPFSGQTPPDTHDTIRSSEQPQRQPTESLVSQEAASLPVTPEHTEQRPGGLGAPQGGMGDDPSVKSEGLLTQEEESNGTHTGGAPAVTAAQPTAPSTQLETEEDFGSFELLTHVGQSGEPVDIQPTVEDLGATQPDPDEH